MKLRESKWVDRTRSLGATIFVAFCLTLSVEARSDQALCMTFAESGLDQALLETMQEAARQGYLYEIDQGKSSIGFALKRFPFGSIKGLFAEFKGGISLGPPDTGDQHALLLIRSKSLTTGRPKLDALLKDSGLLDASRFPQILFVSRRVEWSTPSDARLLGDLTMHGVTRPIEFNLAIMPILAQQDPGDRSSLVVRASASFNRSDFGVNRYGLWVGDTVHLDVRFKITPVQARLVENLIQSG